MQAIYTSWRHDCERLRYPFADSATLVNSRGDTFPVDAIVDASLYPVGATVGLYLSSVQVTDLDVVLTFSGPDGAIATATWVKDDGAPDTLPVTDLLGRPAGMIVLGDVGAGALTGWPVGVYAFASEQTRLAPDVVIPTPEVGFRGFVLPDGEVFSGHIRFVAEDGVYFRYEDDQIKIDASGDPLFLRRGCEDEAGEDDLYVPPIAGQDAGSYIDPITGELVVVEARSSVAGSNTRFDDGPFLRTINEVPPDASGNLVIYPGVDLVEDTVIRVVALDHGLMFKLVHTG